MQYTVEWQCKHNSHGWSLYAHHHDIRCPQLPGNKVKGQKPTPAYFSLQSSFNYLSGFYTLCLVDLSICPLPHAGLASSGRHYSLLIYSQQTHISAIQVPLQSPVWSALSMLTGGHSVPSSLSSSLLTISSEPLSIVGVCWSSQVERQSHL